MVRTIQNFTSKHQFAGTLNKVGLYRDLLHFYNHECSLPFVYGISGLFGFSFNSAKTEKKQNEIFPDFKVPPFHTSGNYFFGLNNALRATNVWCQRGAKVTEEEFIEVIKTYINEGRPIMIDVEQKSWFNLSNLASIVDKTHKKQLEDLQQFLKDSHNEMGEYGVICIGYNDENNTLQILDTNSSQTISISFTDFYNCTNQHNTYCAPANKWFVFYVPPELPEKENMVKYSIQNTVNLMLNPLQLDGPFYLGLEGLQCFSNEFKEVFSKETDLYINRSIAQLHFSSSSYHSRFDYNRLVFAEFLSESASILNKPRLEKISGLYSKLSANWNEFFLILRSKSQSNEINISLAFSVLDNIVNKEKEAIEWLGESI